MFLSSKRKSARGFTLVELLVVIAIVIILAGIAVPSYNMTLTHARTAKCALNLRQVAGALITFAGDNNGNFPESGGTIIYNTPDSAPPAGSGLYGWTQQLEPYVGVGSSKEDPSGNSIYQCPDRGLIPNNKYYSYYNGAHAAYAQDGGVFAPVNLMRMHSPSQHIIAGDIANNGTFSINDCDKDDYNQDPAFSSTITIHGGSVNIAFADGHVENLRSFDSSKMTTVYLGLGYNYTGVPPVLGNSP